MIPLGMPTSMFMVFVATVLAGSLGAIHYLVVHVILGKPFGDEGVRKAPEAGSGTAPSAEARAGGRRGPVEYRGGHGRGEGGGDGEGSEDDEHGNGDRGEVPSE